MSEHIMLSVLQDDKVYIYISPNYFSFEKDREDTICLGNYPFDFYKVIPKVDSAFIKPYVNKETFFHEFDGIELKCLLALCVLNEDGNLSTPIDANTSQFLQEDKLIEYKSFFFEDEYSQDLGDICVPKILDGFLKIFSLYDKPHHINMIGQAGNGKTVLGKNFHKIVEKYGLQGYSVAFFNASSLTRPDSLFEIECLEDGKFYRKLSPLAEALITPNTIVFIDEINRGVALSLVNALLLPMANNVLNTQFCGNYEVPAENFFVFSMNPPDEYSGTAEMDSAFDDRVIEIPIKYERDEVLRLIRDLVNVSLPSEKRISVYQMQRFYNVVEAIEINTKTNVKDGNIGIRKAVAFIKACIFYNEIYNDVNFAGRTAIKYIYNLHNKKETELASLWERFK